MANDFAKAVKTAYHTFHTASNDFRASWQVLTDPIVEQEYTYQEAEVFGLTVYAAQGDSPTPIDFDSASTSVNMAAYEQVVKVTFADLKNIAGLRTQAAELARMGWLTISRAFWDAVDGLDATTHPHNAETWITDGAAGTAYYTDSVQIDPVNASAFTQVNVYTTALADSAVSASLAAHSKFLDYAGNPIPTTDDAPYLIYPPDLETTANNILAPRSETYAGDTPTQVAEFNGRLKGGVVIRPTTYDATDWWLWWTSQVPDAEGTMHKAGPIRPWVRTPPNVRFEMSTTSNHMYMIGYAEYAVFYGARNYYDVIQHKVA